MSNVREMSIDSLLRHFDTYDHQGDAGCCDYSDEVRRRLQRDNATQIALWEIRKIPVMPFPDRAAHSEHAFGDAVWAAWSRIQQIAAAALNEPR